MSKDSSARYYQKNKKMIQKRYQIFSEEEKIGKREYCCERYINFSETEKQKPVGYIKIHYQMRKNEMTNVL